MSIEVQSDSPLAKALQDVVRNKLVEVGWSTGLQDDTLCEYIILMLANGKSKQELASELATDLLEMDGQNPDTASFADWLFEQVQILNQQLNGGPAPDTSIAPAAVPTSTVSADQSADAAMSDNMEEMRQNVPPTGPKAQRNGIQKGRDKRMFGQMKSNLGQTNDAALHRVRGSAGAGRINTHSRDPPKGPRSQQIQRGLGMGNGRGMQNVQVPGMMNGGNMQTPEFMSPQEQMTFYQSLAENARVMALQMQHMTQAMGGGIGAGMFPQVNQPGKPLHERTDRPNRQHNRGDRRHDNQSQPRAKDKDTEMTEDVDSDAPANDQSQAAKDLSRTVCRFDITCQKADCQYAHHSPIAGPYDNLETIDVDTECTYGVACKNKFCKNRHPSRAKKLAQQKEQECTFGPFCTRYPNCPFKHPNVRACKNGADCTVEDCQFYHSKILCKHRPCTNNYCPYKHEPGQKQKWSEGGNVAERKFVDDTAPEEVILPGKDEAVMATDTSVQTVQPEAEIVT